VNKFVGLMISASVVFANPSAFADETPSVSQILRTGGYGTSPVIGYVELENPPSVANLQPVRDLCKAKGWITEHPAVGVIDINLGKSGYVRWLTFLIKEGYSVTALQSVDGEVVDYAAFNVGCP
jgi:hypothetical protein